MWGVQGKRRRRLARYTALNVYSTSIVSVPQHAVRPVTRACPACVDAFVRVRRTRVLNLRACSMTVGLLWSFGYKASQPVSQVVSPQQHPKSWLERKALPAASLPRKGPHPNPTNPPPPGSGHEMNCHDAKTGCCSPNTPCPTQGRNLYSAALVSDTQRSHGWYSKACRGTKLLAPYVAGAVEPQRAPCGVVAASRRCSPAFSCSSG